MKRSSVYVAYTGGTIGMRRGEGGYRPAPGFLEEEMARMPELASAEMPRYTIGELDPLLDSSETTPPDWVKIAAELAARYDDYDGFVVLHGTDTMAYSAAALSFMFDHLAKPVIFTGSQLPLLEVRNDARDNLITSLLIAARHPVPEVCLFFGDRLLRGNRATKVSAEDFRAFDSPNYPPLGTAGVHLEIHASLLRPPPTEPFRFREVAWPRVANVHFFPGLRAETLRHFLRPPIEGAVLHTYGVGNAPARPDFLAALREASERGVVIVNCTQCLEGTVDMEGYATGKALHGAGVLSGFDMTPEAALTKLIYLLSLDLPVDEVRLLVQEDLRGELTPHPDPLPAGERAPLGHPP